jgi:hypothetical protein
VGRTTRTHHDIDVSILREDAPLLRRLLQGWDLQLAPAGVLTPWDTDTIEAPFNSIWCRATPTDPWSLQVMFDEGTATEWVCRRHPEIRLPMTELICQAPDGTPYIAPQVQLFMKAKDTRPKDDADHATVVPLLSPRRSAGSTIAYNATTRIIIGCDVHDERGTSSSRHIDHRFPCGLHGRQSLLLGRR